MRERDRETQTSFDRRLCLILGEVGLKSFCIAPIDITSPPSFQIILLAAFKQSFKTLNSHKLERIIKRQN